MLIKALTDTQIPAALRHRHPDTATPTAGHDTKTTKTTMRAFLAILNFFP